MDLAITISQLQNKSACSRLVHLELGEILEITIYLYKIFLFLALEQIRFLFGYFRDLQN